MIFGDLGGLKLPGICLTGEEKPQKKNLTQETCPDRGLNPGPPRDRHACYHLSHSWWPPLNNIIPYCQTETCMSNYRMTTCHLRASSSFFVSSGIRLMVCELFSFKASQYSAAISLLSLSFSVTHCVRWWESVTVAYLVICRTYSFQKVKCWIDESVFPDNHALF